MVIVTTSLTRVKGWPPSNTCWLSELVASVAHRVVGLPHRGPEEETHFPHPHAPEAEAETSRPGVPSARVLILAMKTRWRFRWRDETMTFL